MKPILSAGEDGERRAYARYLSERWELEKLKEEYPYETDLLDALMEVALDILCSKQRYLRIEGDEKPIEVVKAAIMKLDPSHISYVADSLSRNATKIKNIKRYMLAALYNAPLTMKTHYQSWVNHDIARGLFEKGGRKNNEDD